jgi:hypothetical protein
MWLDGSYYVSLDTEFIAPNLTKTGLVSLGLATGDDRFYAVNRDMDTTMEGLNRESQQWMRKNVWPHLPGWSPEEFDRSHMEVMAYEEIAVNVEAFFDRVMVEVNDDIDKVVLFAHCGAQDLIRLRLLWNDDWSILPRSVPNWGDDVKRMRLAVHLRSEDLPEQDEATRHHALLDAVHELSVVRFIVENDPHRGDGLV